MSAIVSFKNSRFDGIDVQTVNVIGNGWGGFKLQKSPKTGHADVLLLLNRGSPSMFKDSINLLFRASISVRRYFFNVSKIISLSPK